MSARTDAPTTVASGSDSIAEVIAAQVEDLGAFSVRRALPAATRTMVGPFIFFDHIGPAEFPPGGGIQVRPHPHICLATLTYLFEGEIIHRDSLGYVQPIQPGAVNLMTAGRGIVHSERAREGVASATRLHGIQCWMALPDAEEECEPAFVHYEADALPEVTVADTRVRVIAGEAYGRISPVRSHAPMLYLECHVPEGCELTLPASVAELAVYVVSGEVRIDQRSYADGVMAVARTGQPVHLAATRASHLIVLGGEPVGPRHIWWNFVSSSNARIEQAKADWRANRFGRIPGETEFIPLPD